MKKGIALLITLMFIMAITVSIGIGLSYTKKAQHALLEENFLFQSSMILNDVLSLLKNSKELSLIQNDSEGTAFAIFLAQSSFIPFEASGIQVALEITSARSKFNPTTLLSPDKKTIYQARVSALKNYLAKKMVNETYVDILLDGLGGLKDDLSYNSAVYNTNDTLFRDYIVSAKHLKVYNDFYRDTFYDNALENVEFDKLFYYSGDVNASNTYIIDLNYATAEVWAMMLGVDEVRAEQLAFNGGTYSENNKADLSSDESRALESFKTTYKPQLYLDVKVEIIQDRSSAKIAFEYDIKKARGYNFSYEI